MRQELTHRGMQAVASVVWRAARREPELARMAIAWSIRNRIANLGSEGFGDVAVTCADLLGDLEDPEIPLERAVRTGPGFGDADYCRATTAACLVWCGDVADPTDGANRFHRHDKLPVWAATMQPVALLGSYFFYREDCIQIPVAKAWLPDCDPVRGSMGCACRSGAFQPGIGESVASAG